MKKGLFVTFEGIDGSGKTTQVQEFIRRLKEASLPFLLVREPGGTEIGEKIRDILLDKANSDIFPVTELLLYSASRHQLIRQSVLSSLQNGEIVVLDRFFDSTTAYQGFGRGIDLSFIKRLNSIATESLKPDLTIILDIPVSEREKRLSMQKLDRMEMENFDFNERVRQGFLSIAKEEPERIKVIDGTLSSGDISKIVWNNFKKIKKEKFLNENF